MHSRHQAPRMKNMKTCILVLTIISLLLEVSFVKGFSPISLGAVKNHTPCSQQRSRATCSTYLSLSRDSNQEAGDESSKSSKADDDTVDNDELEDYDFEAGFQARLKKEGGATRVQVKTAAKRSVESVTRGATQGVTESANILGLLTSSQWGMTVGVLGLVVLLAIGTHLASPAPFETTSNGEQLTFGVR
mmetsp:Transcript_5141/g.8445  ORF Transcript_5141/g.8445 Transcript_5141/m.8445 type:complete len:190 (-) Transcript_5141:75-644(-)